MDFPTLKLATGITADVISIVVGLIAIIHARRYLAAQAKAAAKGGEAVTRFSPAASLTVALAGLVLLLISGVCALFHVIDANRLRAAHERAGQVHVEGWVLPADYPAVAEALNRGKALPLGPP